MVSSHSFDLSLLSSLPAVAAVGVWYTSSVAFNVALKRICRQLTVFIEATAAEMLFGSLTLLLLGAVALRRPTVRDVLCPPRSTLVLLNAIAASHVVGNLCTNYGVQHLDVAFVHTVKSSEPLFALAISRVVGVPSIPIRPAVLGSLLLIVVGVAIMAASQARLHTTAFAVSVGSCVGFQLRNVLTKRLRGTGEGPVSVLALLGWMSFFGLAQMGLLLAVHQAVGIATGSVLYSDTLLKRRWTSAIVQGLVASSFYHGLYNAASIGVLYTMTPVTHSVINSLKRVCIIVISSVALGYRPSLSNCVGILCALFGATSYSLVKRHPAAPPLPAAKTIELSKVLLLPSTAVV